jgi:hypothetical protein
VLFSLHARVQPLTTDPATMIVPLKCRVGPWLRGRCSSLCWTPIKFHTLVIGWKTFFCPPRVIFNFLSFHFRFGAGGCARGICTSLHHPGAEQNNNSVLSVLAARIPVHWQASFLCEEDCGVEGRWL